MPGPGDKTLHNGKGAGNVRQERVLSTINRGPADGEGFYGQQPETLRINGLDNISFLAARPDSDLVKN